MTLPTILVHQRSQTLALPSPASSRQSFALPDATAGTYGSRESGRGSHPHDLARVHDVVGVEGLLDQAHDAERFAVLGLQEVDLAIADAVLAGAGALHGEGAGDQAGVEALGLGDILGIV